MVFGLFNRHKGVEVDGLYRSIVAQARHPVFYRDWSVADTVDGRFEMLVLHLVLSVERLRGENRAISPAGQAVFDLFLKDMDRSLREMGVGDLSVGKRMKKLGKQVYGRFDAFGPALAAGDRQTLAEAIDRNVFAGDPKPDDANRLAGYALTAAEQLASQSTSDIESGRVNWPEPDQTERGIDG
ncbi:ubiquinol-cytochrome C chaperone family protein [Amorphus coralli]|uniref:ubiquinol-cytochrome C chaperone family protein n=1 Tax=Amorphus coralli TaxID=340680 RepID=UPI0003785371|nr:ubiquinol-cytochrome C chaperone family protein [Amorphus coralli]